MAMVSTLLIEALEYMRACRRAGMTLRRAAYAAHRLYPIFPARALVLSYREQP